MPIPFPSRPLLALPLMAPLLGCASKPAEPPIVLRPQHTTKSALHRPVPKSKQETRTASAPANSAAPSPANETTAPPADPAGLTNEQKEALFRDFDAYLSKPSRN